MKRLVFILLVLLGCGFAGRGQSWYPVGANDHALNTNWPIYSVCSDSNGNIYAAGQFTDTDYFYGPHYVAKWDNGLGQWAELGSGIHKLNANANIYTVHQDKAGHLYAGGAFSNGVNEHSGSKYVAIWDNAMSSWSELGAGGANPLNANGPINSICSDDSGNVYAAGNFRDIYGYAYVARWSHTTNQWTEIGWLRADVFINTICLDDSLNVYAAGTFTDTLGKTYVAKWDHITNLWSELGSGFDSVTSADVVIKSIFADSGNHINAAVNFENASGVTSGNVFRWDGSHWSQLGALNSNNFIQSICKGDSGFVYAGGSFTNTSGNIYVARYDPATNAWSEVGASISPFGDHTSFGSLPAVFSVCTDPGHHLYAGGSFTDSISATNNGGYVARYGYPPSNLSIIENIVGNIEIYPNPASDEISIKSDRPLTGDYVLFDYCGRVLLSGRLRGNSQNTISIDIYSVPAGVFIFNINEKKYYIIKLTTK